MNSPRNVSADQSAIRELLENWAAAVRDKNLPDVLADHSPEILMFDLPGPTQARGLDAYEKSWPPLFRWFGDSGAFDLSEVEVTASGDVAFATALIYCRGIEANGDVTELDVRLTVGLYKDDGRWMVAHEHHSVPSL